MPKAKRKIKGREFLGDLRSGLGRSGLLNKYRLSEQNLERVLDQIVSMGLLDRQALLTYLSTPQPAKTVKTRLQEEPTLASGKSPRLWTPEQIQAFREQVGIKSHVEFVSGLLARHQLDSETGHESARLLGRIRRKESEEQLSLGVIGEFSSGKSTLINALIRDDLLRADVLQATTAAATELHHGTELDVEVILQDGAKKSFLHDKLGLLRSFARWRGRRNPEKQKVNIREFIHTVTADEDVARNVTQVRIFHPSKTLSQGMVIVDTPGTNAEIERHVLVTQWAMREICDAAIVAIPADIPVSQTLVAFLASNLTDVLHRCVFIVTKLDLLKPRETERQLQAVRGRLRSYLGLANPLVMGCAPQIIVDGLNGNGARAAGKSRLSNEEIDALKQRFQEVEQAVWSTLRHQKLLIQLEGLSALMSQLLSRLDMTLKDRDRGYRERHEALERNKIPDLWDFVTKEKTKYVAAFNLGVAGLSAQATNIVECERESCVSQISQAIYSVENKGALKIAVESKAQAIVNNAQAQLESRFKELCNQIESSANEQYQNFQQEFMEKYRSLATLGGKISGGPGAVGVGAGQLARDFDRGLNALMEKMGGDFALAEVAAGGMGLGGLVLGGLVFGPLGAVIAGVLAGLLGLLFGPSLEELKQKCWDEISTGIQDCFSRVEQAVAGQIQSDINSTRTQLSQIIETYYREYDQLVKKMIERDEKEKQELATIRQTVMHDLKEIELRREKLEQVREKLRKL